MLNLLIEKQKAIGAKNADFAALLGVKRSMWSQIKSGKKCRTVLSDRILKHVARNFPDLKLEALKEMGLTGEITT